MHGSTGAAAHWRHLNLRLAILMVGTSRTVPCRGLPVSCSPPLILNSSPSMKHQAPLPSYCLCILVWPFFILLLCIQADLSVCLSVCLFACLFSDLIDLHLLPSSHNVRLSFSWKSTKDFLLCYTFQIFPLPTVFPFSLIS